MQRKPEERTSTKTRWGTRVTIRRPLGEGRRSVRLVAEAWTTSNATFQRDGRAATRETQHAPARARRLRNRRSWPRS